MRIVRIIFVSIHVLYDSYMCAILFILRHTSIDNILCVIFRFDLCMLLRAVRLQSLIHVDLFYCLLFPVRSISGGVRVMMGWWSAGVSWSC